MGSYCTFVSPSRASRFWSAIVLMMLLVQQPVATQAQSFADEGWGDLGYSKTEAEVEAIPDSFEADSVEPSPQALAANSIAPESAPARNSAERNITEIEGDSIVAPAEESEPSSVTAESLPPSEAPLYQPAPAAKSQAKPKKSSTRTFGNISTLENTHGVLTEESKPVQFYVSPFGGVSNLVGNTTVESSSRFAVGAQGGFLLSSNFLLQVGYTYSEHGLSSPRSQSTSVVFGVAQDMYRLKTNHIEVGGRLFILDREARVRPFFGGGFGWAKSYLNYTTANLQAVGYQPQFVKDYTLNQFDAFGEIGAEVAITRAVVLNASFRLRGILGTTTSVDSGEDASSYDPSKLLVGDSLSRTASYTLGAGLGIYF